MNMGFDIHEVIASLMARRPVFHSEADFQHELAWAIREADMDAELRLEVPVRFLGSQNYLDIFVRSKGVRYGIELKYKTRAEKISLKGEEFSLAHHGAQPLGFYDFMKDISRLEKMIGFGTIDEGFAVMLTNEKTYSQPSKRVDTNGEIFRTHHGRVVTGDLAWPEATSAGMKKSREASLSLTGSYTLRWSDIVTHQQLKFPFRYIAVHVAAK